MEDTSPSSKVTVEYHDPSGLFPLLSRDLVARLPLRNLNWRSPPRPLRQIKSLHLDFAPDQDSQHTAHPPSSRPTSGSATSLEIVRGGATDVRKNAGKERRHQIPGFRTSPYLKIYLLRCDDKDVYKDVECRNIRQWIKENGQPEGKRDEHDAFEWLILHVVVPDTVAASEPRWRESAKDPDELKERKSGNKLIGKSTRTVFDRLRADFNDSGRLAQDRIAQIRLPKTSVPSDLLPTPAVAQTLEESAQERENAWSDLISKFKVLILGPFDRRVRQYEADIAEQESRRSLPGWNFCTFFIHKEGLAKALESIGLVEDALAIYDELALGLETVLREIAAGQAQGTATSFAAYTDDIDERISGMPETYTNGTDDDTTNETRDTACLFRKGYRELIARSTISLFDFFCYIFTRQKALILRLANARSVRVQLGADGNREGGEDLVLTSEVCWRASSFIHNVSRTLRQDIANRATARHYDFNEVESESIVCSWAWAVAGQVLEETAVPALLDITKSDGHESTQLPNGTHKRLSLAIGLGANPHPQRMSSLPAHGFKATGLQRPRPDERPQTEGGIRPTSSSGAEATKSLGLPGQAELATYRAELITIRRKMLEQLAQRHGWYAGWAYTKHYRTSKLEDVSLDEGNRDSVLSGQEPPPLIVQVSGPTIRSALISEEAFQAAYEELTDSAIRHYCAATQSKCADTLFGDLAILKSQQQDYHIAASHFQRVLPLISTENWNLMELEALHAYARCLKQLKRLDEYIQTGLALLAKIATRKVEQSELYVGKTSRSMSQAYEALNTAGLFTDLMSASGELSHDVIQPVKPIFVHLRLHSEVMHEDGSDAFLLNLQLRNILAEEVEFDKIEAHLVGYADPSQEIQLSSSGPVILKHGLNSLNLRGPIVAYGPFLVERIILSAKRLRFVEELRPKPKPTPLGFTEVEPPAMTVSKADKPPAFIFLYPAEHAFNADLRRSRSIQVNKTRHLEIVLNAGQNQIQALEVRPKPTSAGLRLHLADATCNGITRDATDVPRSGQLNFHELHRQSEASVRIPYTVEQAHIDIAVRLEILYRTSQGTFTFLDSVKLANELPLDIDVNDIFHTDALYSNFTVRTTVETPLSVLEAHLEDSPVYAVERPPRLPLPLTVYKSQPLSLAYKISCKSPIDNKTLKRDAALALTVKYHSLDELFLACLSRTLADKLQQSSFHTFSRLLIPLLLHWSREFTTAAEYEIAAILGEFAVPDFDKLGWPDLIQTLPEPVRSPLELWLREWHAEHSVLSTISIAAQEAATQQIIISVDVPNVDVVFNTSLELVDCTLHATSGPPILTLGQPVQAIVHVKHSSKWSAKSIFPNVPTFKFHGDDDYKPSFVYEVGIDSEAWVIGGRRRCHFTLQDGNEHSFNVVVVPVKAGTYPLPFIEVREAVSDPEAGHKSHDASCETHYESSGHVVQVIRDIRTSKIHIGETLSTTALLQSRPGTASSKEPG